MNTFFVPSTRFHDLYHDFDPDDESFFWDEVMLRKGQSVGDLLRPGYTWEDFFVVVRKRMVWLSPEVLVETGPNTHSGYLDIFGYKQVLSVETTKASEGGELREVFRVRTHRSSTHSSSSSEQAATICELLLQLLTRGDFSEVRISFLSPVRSYPCVSSLALSKFLTNCRGLAGIRFSQQVRLTDEYLHVLEAAASPDLRITLFESSLSEVEPRILKNFLSRDHGTTALHGCSRRIPLLSDFLRGDSSIEELHIHGDKKTVGDSDMSNLVRALATNQSLKVLRVHFNPIRDENWVVLCQSLARHPKLKTLRLVGVLESSAPSNGFEKIITRRTEAVVEMLRVNTVLEDLYLLPKDCDVHILRDVIRPYMHFLANIRALSESQRPGRAPVLARALYKANRCPALLWMLLSNNGDELTSGLVGVSSKQRVDSAGSQKCARTEDITR
jgi:hypothetical protein